MMQLRLTYTNMLFLCALLFCSVPSHAAEYRLQLANIDEHVFLRYVDTQGAPFKVAQHTLPHLVETLNRSLELKYVVLPDYELQPVNVTPLDASQWEKVRGVLGGGNTSPWTMAAWDGTPGKLALLQIRGFQKNWQELTQLAVQTDGVLQRLPVEDVPLFGHHKKLAAPATSTTYITHSLERGTFLERVAAFAVSHDGLSVIVGRNHDIHFPDTVYLLIHQPDTTKTYTLVLGWKHREELEKDGGDGGTTRN